MAHTIDLDLDAKDIGGLSSADAMAGLLTKLGYPTGVRKPLTASSLGVSADTERAIRSVELMAADREDFLRVLLVQVRSLTARTRNELANKLGQTGSDHLIILTADFSVLEFVLVDKRSRQKRGPVGGGMVQVIPRTVTVHRKTSTPMDRRILRRLTWTGGDGLDQYDKLRAAFESAPFASRYFQNKALFSDHYLYHRLPECEAWRENPADTFTRVKSLLQDARRRWSQQPEQQLRDELFEPVWSALGFRANVNKGSDQDTLEPDYLLHGSNGKPVTAAFCYRWGRWLDGPDANDPDTPEENPGAAVVSALTEQKARWIIVTNGKLWRLYSRDAHSRATNYYEVDLEEALAASAETDPNEAFRYWWLFFRRQAFVLGDGAGVPVAEAAEAPAPEQCWLDRIVTGSRDYAKNLGERLKDRVFKAIFPLLARGFLEHRKQQGRRSSPTEAELTDTFEATLTLLYRLLFLLYAEARDLLPIGEAPYEEASLKRIKQEIAEHGGPAVDAVSDRLKKVYTRTGTDLYARLSRLFRVMDQGDNALNVPCYNGGLFQTEATPARRGRLRGEATQGTNGESRERRIAQFLIEHQVPDFFLALAVDRLARDEDEKPVPGAVGSGAKLPHGLVFIDYKSLEVRHLGSIYEGLLEFKLKIAEEDLGVTTEKKAEKYIPLSQVKTGRSRRTPAAEAVVRKGEVYLSNDKSERKATGSYYTPDPIVEYIVEHTVGPVLAEKLGGLRDDMRKAGKTFHRYLENFRANPGLVPGQADARTFAGEKTYAEHKDLVDRLFDFKVLDPAMGSGHFLVEAVDFITDGLLDFLNRFPNNPVTFALERTRASILAALGQQGVAVDAARLTDVNLLKRHVLKRCIYGVDLNPMAVELAKVSLWLDAFTLGAPLSFLDHHLRCGNSLIGATFEDLKKVTEGQLFAIDYGPLIRAIRHVLFVNAMADATAAEVHQSADEYAAARRELSGYQIVLDLLVADYFMDSKLRPSKLLQQASDLDLTTRAKLLASLDEKATRLLDEVEKVARRPDLRFFHWEIEFPEVFFGFADAATERSDETLRRLESSAARRTRPTQTIDTAQRQIQHRNDIAAGSAGFDALVGNPPYDEVSTAAGHDASIRDYLDAPATYGGFKNGRTNLYRLFVLRAVSLLRHGGAHGYIVPLGLLSDMFSLKVRSHLLDNTSIRRIEAFPQKDDPTRRVFCDAKLPTAVYALRLGTAEDACQLTVHPGKELREVSFTVHFETGRIAELFPTTLTLPLISEPEFEILERRFHASVGPELREIAGIFAGEICDNAVNRRFLSDDPVGPLVLRGAHIDRYRLRSESTQGADRFLHEERFLRERSDAERTSHHELDRVVFQKGAALDNWRRLIATIVPRGHFCFDTTGYLIPHNPDHLHTFLALMNSTLWEWRFRCVSQTNHVNAYEIGPFRVPSEITGGRFGERLSTLAKEALASDKGVWRSDTHVYGSDDEIDQKIDDLIFEAYALTDAERGVVLTRIAK